MTVDVTPASAASPSSIGAATAPLLAVVLHDVATSTLAACERTLRAVADVAQVPVTLLAVPRYHHEKPTRSFEQWLSERNHQGDELSLHGLTHLDESTPRGWLDRMRRETYTRGEGEFWALSEGDAATRLQQGVDWFSSHGWPLHGFVAPAWLLGAGGWAALRRFDFRYTSTLRHLFALPSGREWTSQSIVYSTSKAWRRQSSVLWAAVVSGIERRNPVLRLELHPSDADHAAVRRSWQRILAKHIATHQAVTVAQAVATLDTRARTV